MKTGLIVVGMGGVGSSLIAGLLGSRPRLERKFGSFAVGAFELRRDDAYCAAVRAGLERSLLDELRTELRGVHAMIGARLAPTRRELVDLLAADLRGFLAHHECERGVVVCTIPGRAPPPARPPVAPDEVWAALENDADWVTPGTVYAAAAVQAGCSFIAAAPDPALAAPGIQALFVEKGLPIMEMGFPILKASAA